MGGAVPPLPKGAAVKGHLNASQLPESDDTAYTMAAARLSRVLLPIMFLNGALAHFEKGNLAFAALQLNKQLGFTALEYGVGSGLYFLGYGVGILPSTFATMRYGARRSLGAMTFVCGVVGVMHALIRNRPGFYLLRCLLGLAEAGGGSSMGHLLAQFYPKDKRAQPFTIMMLSYFAAGILAAPLATGLMSMDGLGGLHGWQWLFMMEAIPSLLMGVVMWVWLPSHPLTAWCLTPEQRQLVHLRVHGSEEEAEAAKSPPRWSQMLAIIWRTMRRPLLWYLTASSLLHGLSFFSFFPWMAIIIQNMLNGTALQGSTSSGQGHGHGSGGGHGHGVPVKAILLSSVPALTGSVAAIVCAWHSDKRKERHLHIAITWLLAGVLLALFGPTNSVSFVVGFTTLVAAKTLASASSGVFSSLLVGILDTRNAGIGLALHHAVVACVAGFAGPVFVGALVQRTGSFSMAMACNGTVQVAASLLMFGLAAWERGWIPRKRAPQAALELQELMPPASVVGRSSLGAAPPPDLEIRLSLSERVSGDGNDAKRSLRRFSSS